MGVDYYLHDDERREIYWLGRGHYWSAECFSLENMSSEEALRRYRDAVVVWKSELIETLVQFLSTPRTVALSSDSADCGSNRQEYTIVGSRYTSDYDDPCLGMRKVGRKYTRFIWDDEKDGWHWPKTETK